MRPLTLAAALALSSCAEPGPCDGATITIEHDSGAYATMYAQVGQALRCRTRIQCDAAALLWIGDVGTYHRGRYEVSTSNVLCFDAGEILAIISRGGP